MLLRAAERMNLDCSRSIMIGDRWSDVEAARAAGCKSIFINLNYRDRRPTEPDFVVSSFVEATDVILGMP
jgi:D-glycero-D-manno-heptose 1,7-bisphosphate phosphatase